MNNSFNKPHQEQTIDDDKELDAALNKIKSSATSSSHSNNLNDDQANKEKLLQDLKQMISHILNVEVDKLNPDVSLVSLGLESVTASQFANTVNERYQLNISPTVFFEFATLRFFTDYLYQGFKLKVIDALQTKKSEVAPTSEKFTAKVSESTKTTSAKSTSELDIDALWTEASKEIDKTKR